MKNLKLGLALASAILLVGCGAKNPPKLQEGKNLGINNALLEQKYSFVPKDEFLSNVNFVYELEAIPSGEYLIANELMVKTFLLAHNASKIIIIGDKDKIRAIKESDFKLSSTKTTQAKNAITCPQCQNGFLVRRESKNKKGTFFYGCSEFKNGCKFICYERNGKPLLQNTDLKK